MACQIKLLIDEITKISNDKSNVGQNVSKSIIKEVNELINSDEFKQLALANNESKKEKNDDNRSNTNGTTNNTDDINNNESNSNIFIKWLNDKKNIVVDKNGKTTVTVNNVKELKELSSKFSELVNNRGMIKDINNKENMSDEELNISHKWMTDIFKDLENKMFENGPIKVSFVQSIGNTDKLGEGSGDKNIRIVTNKNYPGITPMKVILHEYAHVITIDAIMKNESIRKRIREIMDRAVSLKKDNKLKYAFTNEVEFIAEVISNPKLQNELSKIESDSKNSKTLLEQVFNIFKNMLNRLDKNGKTSALTDALEVIIDINNNSNDNKSKEENKKKVTTSTAGSNGSSNTPEFDKMPEYDENVQTMTYAGVGSRNTQQDILKEMTRIAKKLEEAGYKLNTGKTFGNKEEGADKAFSDGTNNKELFGPENIKINSREWKIAEEIHKNWQALTRKWNGDPNNYEGTGGARLMARNTNQVFGENLDTPVDFVLAWTPLNENGEIVTRADQRTYEKNSEHNTGGTGQAIAMASLKGIPVINMADPEWETQLNEVIAKQNKNNKQNKSDVKDESNVEKESDNKTDSITAEPASPSNETKEYTPNEVTSLKENEIFVFGSNDAGIHGKGAAKDAVKFGAKKGVGEGISGNTYAIPTKDSKIESKKLGDIAKSVNKFIEYAKQNPDKKFIVTPIGTGLAGFELYEIAPMFKHAEEIDNIILPKSFSDHNNKNTKVEPASPSKEEKNNEVDTKYEDSVNESEYSKYTKEEQKQIKAWEYYHREVYNLIFRSDDFKKIADKFIGRTAQFLKRNKGYFSENEVYTSTIVGINEYNNLIDSDGVEIYLYDDTKQEYQNAKDEYIESKLKKPNFDDPSDDIPFQHKSEEELLKDNEELGNRILEHLKNMFPNITVKDISNILDKDGIRVLGAAMKDIVMYDSEIAGLDTIPHEYAHIYIDMLEKTTYIKNTLGMIVREKHVSKSEAKEILATKMGQYIVEIARGNPISSKYGKLSNKDKSLMKKIWDNIIKIFKALFDSKGLLKDKNEIRAQILSKKMYEGINSDAISFTNKKGTKLIDPTYDFEHQKFSSGIVYDVMDSSNGKAVFTGSEALAMQGNVYRKQGENGTDLHDLDFSVPDVDTSMNIIKKLDENYSVYLYSNFYVPANEELAKNLEELVVRVPQLMVLEPLAKKAVKYIEKNNIKTLAVLEKGYHVANVKKFNEEEDKGRIISYDIMNDKNEIVGTYEAEVKLKEQGFGTDIVSETKTGVEAVLVDLIEDKTNKKTITWKAPNGQNISISHYSDIFDAKNRLSSFTPRDKDAIDFNTFFKVNRVNKIKSEPAVQNKDLVDEINSMDNAEINMQEVAKIRDKDNQENKCK